MIRTPVCNHDPATTVGCHKPRGSGGGMKSSDLHMAWGCSACHQLVDTLEYNGTRLTREDADMYWYEGMDRTLEQLIKLGKVKW